MSDDIIPMSSDQLKALIKEAVNEAVNEAFFDVGLRTYDPESIEGSRRDFSFLRRAREATEDVASKVGWFVVMTVLGGLLFAMWVGFKDAIKLP